MTFDEVILPSAPFEIVPHVGIGLVRLGMSRGEVESILSPLPNALPRCLKGRSSRIECYFDNAFQVEFDVDETASFIEVWSSLAIACKYKGRDVFDLAALDMFALFAADDKAGPHTYRRTEYLFPDLIVAVWDPDEQYDHKGKESRPVYGTVGVGDERYLAAVLRIRGQSGSAD